MRRAIDRSYAEGPSGGLDEALAETFGLWKDRELDGAAYVDKLRRGMGRRLDRR